MTSFASRTATGARAPSPKGISGRSRIEPKGSTFEAQPSVVPRAMFDFERSAGGAGRPSGLQRGPLSLLDTLLEVRANGESTDQIDDTERARFGSAAQPRSMDPMQKTVASDRDCEMRGSRKRSGGRRKSDEEVGAKINEPVKGAGRPWPARRSKPSLSAYMVRCLPLSLSSPSQICGHLRFRSAKPKTICGHGRQGVGSASICGHEMAPAGHLADAFSGLSDAFLALADMALSGGHSRPLIRVWGRHADPTTDSDPQEARARRDFAWRFACACTPRFA